MQTENRKSQRRSLRVPVLIWEVDDEKRLGSGKEIVMKDLSTDGIAFYSAAVYPIDTILHIEIFLPNRKKPVDCNLRVVSLEALLKKDEYVIGASFFDLQPEDRTALSEMVEKLDLYVLLDSVVQGRATDLHLTIGRVPMVRKNGRIMKMAQSVIEEGQIEAMLYPLLSEEQIKVFDDHKELNFAFSPDPGSRFRVNIHRQKGYVEAVLRNVPTTVPSFETLGLPVEQMVEFCGKKSGLILIAGSTGAGKTTTLSAMVDHINKNQEKVVVTVEDPVEYIFRADKGIVKQRELGSDTLSYPDALRHVLRQDPDVICVGELLDPESLRATMRAAETAHLVISTIHAPNTASAIERAIAMFPPEHAYVLRQQLSNCLIGVLYQTLLPKSNGGRILATELMINNNAIKNLIREGHYAQIPNVIQTGRGQGMYTLKNSLDELHRNGLIDDELLLNFSEKENRFVDDY